MQDFIGFGLPVPAPAMTGCVLDGVLDLLYFVVAAALADAVGDEQQADEHLVAAHARLEALAVSA
jgi:hypothetical protein